MIHAICIENAHLYGEALPSIHKLRKKRFVDEQKWEIPTFKDMEYDAYDNPATTYFAYLNNDNKALGIVRIYPTDRPYMIKDVWPELIRDVPMPNSKNIYEGSRFVIDGSLDKNAKKHIKHELVCAMLEYGLTNEIKEYVGVMPDNFWQSVFVKSGWKVKRLGPTIVAEDGSEIYAAQFRVNQFNLLNVRNQTNINTPVLSNNNYIARRAA